MCDDHNQQARTCWNAWCICDRDQPEDAETNLTATRHCDVTGYSWTEAPPEDLRPGEQIVARAYEFANGAVADR